MASNPYMFEVVMDEASLADLDGWHSSEDEDEHDHDHDHDHAEQIWESVSPAQKVIVFSYEPDKLPSPVVVGYQQFKHKVLEAELEGKVLTYLAPLNNLPPLVDVLFVTRELSLPARAVAPNSWIELLDNFLNQPVYNELIQELREAVGLKTSSEEA
jgi:mannitol-specific phosphotransferase system IIBC component